MYNSTMPKYNSRYFLGQSATLIREVLEKTTDPECKQKLQKALELTGELDPYLDATVAPVGPVQSKIWNDTYKEPWDDNFKNGLMSYTASTAMMAGPYESGFLKILAEMTRAEKILEIGMFTGGSAAAFCASPYCKEVVSLDTETYLEEFLKSRIRGTEAESKVRVMIGQALDSLVKLKEEGAQFDMVFIDADKPNYINYYNYVLDNNLLTSTGCIVADNVLWYGDVYPKPVGRLGKIIHEFNSAVVNDPRVNQVILPMRDGVMLIKPITKP
jgi:caffeoyl-CoA O-methyltransferase